MSEPYWVPLNVAAPPNTGAMQKIAEQILAAPATEIVFSAIPQTYAHLMLIGLARSDYASAALTSLRLQLNGDTTANYDSQAIATAGGTVAGVEALAATAMSMHDSIPGGTAPANRFGPFEIMFQHYTNVVACKAAIAKSGMPWQTGVTNTISLRDWSAIWRTFNAPITSIRCFPGNGNLIAGSRISLYGLA